MLVPGSRPSRRRPTLVSTPAPSRMARCRVQSARAAASSRSIPAPGHSVCCTTYRRCIRATAPSPVPAPVTTTASQNPGAARCALATRRVRHGHYDPPHDLERDAACALRLGEVTGPGTNRRARRLLLAVARPAPQYDPHIRGYDESIVNRRRVLRHAAITATVLVALVAITLTALPSIARWLVVSQLSRTTGRQVTLDALELELFKGRFGLHSLRVIDHDGGPLLTVDRMEARFSPRALVGGHLRIFDATVQTPALRIVRTGPETFNISDVLGRLGQGQGRAPAVTIARFAFVGGTLTIEDRTQTPPRTWRIEAVELHATDASTVAGAPPGMVTLSAVAEGAPILLSVE